jgi:hypothetical protein
MVYDDYSGTYMGALHLTTTGCMNAANNGSKEAFVTIPVTQSGQNISIGINTDPSNMGSITVVGTLAQAGQFGAVSGTYSSTSVGEAGNAILVEMNVQFNAFSTRIVLNSTNNGCQNTGYLSGIRSRP